MGSGSDRIIEMQQQKGDEQLAKRLGISYDELMQLDHRVDTDESKEGLIYGYIIRFDNNAPREILDKVIGLQDDYVYLAPWDLGYDDYYEEEYEAKLSNFLSHDTFTSELDNLKRLNEVELGDAELEGIQKRLIFIGVFGTLETYLSDTFITKALNHENYFRNFVESYPEFRQRKFDLKNIYVELDKLKETVKRSMLDVIYHDLPKVREMYHATFKMDFPVLKPLMPYVIIRHDVVHRNGKSKEGEVRRIDKKAVTDLISMVERFVTEIEAKLPNE